MAQRILPVIGGVRIELVATGHVFLSTAEADGDTASDETKARDLAVFEDTLRDHRYSGCVRAAHCG